MAEGGRGGAGEVFKLKPEPPPRGSGSRGAEERPCASSGRDPGVWLEVGPGVRFAQNVPGLPGRGAAAALSQVGAAQRARLAGPLGIRLSRAPLEQRSWSWSGASPPGRRSPPHSSPLPPPPPTSRVEPGLTHSQPQSLSQAPVATNLSREGRGRRSHLTDGKTTAERTPLGGNT